MAKVELIMPKMGESIIEATILKWLKKPGDPVSQDETILEVATDKVDSEVPSPVNGILKEILFPENTVVPINKVIAIIEIEGKATDVKSSPSISEPEIELPKSIETIPHIPESVIKVKDISNEIKSTENRFYSPLVKNIAKEENITITELDSINGSGVEGRVTKQDVLNYLENRKTGKSIEGSLFVEGGGTNIGATAKISTPSITSGGSNTEIIEMDRMRKLIADHMVMSKQTAPHVTSFVEADVTNIVQWREKHKDAFQRKFGEKLTFTPIFIEAIVKAIKDYPLVNVSVDGTKIIVKKNINIGMAAALPSGNLIVPVIKNADHLNLAGLSKSVNDLANRARQNKLKPDEIQDGTFTITNVGTFGNLMGTPIINQPQVAILATGVIKKKPAVLETEHGDVIAIRHMMFLSLSYDHRVVDGGLGGAFLKKISDYLEDFKGQSY